MPTRSKEQTQRLSQCVTVQREGPARDSCSGPRGHEAPWLCCKKRHHGEDSKGKRWLASPLCAVAHGVQEASSHPHEKHVEDGGKELVKAAWEWGKTPLGGAEQGLYHR